MTSSYDPSTMTRRANYYLRLGFTLTPVQWGGKLPTAGKGWNTPAKLITTPDQAAQTWARPHNIGVNLGPSGIVSLDIDEPDMMRADWAARGLDMDATLAAHPHPMQGAGLRLWYRAPEGCPVTTRRHLVDPETGACVFEIRGGPGYQDVAPGSLHPSGVMYRWTVTPPRTRDDLPELPAELAQLWHDLARRTEPTQTPTAHNPRPYTGESVIEAYNARYTPREVLERNGYKQRGDRYISPNSSTKMPGISIYVEGGKQRAVSYHGSDIWADGKGHDAFDLFTLLEHDGNMSRAMDTAREMLGMTRPERPQVTTGPTARELWAAHGEAVMHHSMDVLLTARGHAKSRQKYMDMTAALHAAAYDGCITQRDGKTLIEFGGLAVLAERMLYRGRLHDLRAGLDYLTTLGIIGRITSTNPADKFAPLAAEVTADPRDLPIMRFQGELTLKGTTYNTTKRKAVQDSVPAVTPTLAPTYRKPGSFIGAKPVEPVQHALHAARHVLYLLHRGVKADELTTLTRMTKATIKKHTATLEELGIMTDGTLTMTKAETDTLIRLEVESDPAYRNARVRYLRSCVSFAEAGTQIARRLRSPALHARRSATVTRAADRLTRLMDGESCGAVFGVAA